MAELASVLPDVRSGHCDPLTSKSIDFMSLLSPVNRQRLLEGSTQATYPAGTVVLHPNDPPTVYLMVRGLARSFWSLPDGRQATVAFLRSAELIGAPMAAGQASWMFAQVVTESTLTILDRETVSHLAATDLEVSSAIATHLAKRVRDAYRLVALSTLGTIRERLAYDLLERACQAQLGGGRLEARSTHADLADSIGSSREVMSRALRDLREEGIVETAPGLIRILNPTALAAIARAFVI